MNILTLVNIIMSYIMQFNDWSITSSFGMYTFSINIYQEEKILTDNLIKILQNDLLIDNTISIGIEKDDSCDSLEITINE